MARKRRPIETLDLETDPFKAGRVPEVFAAGHYDGETYNHWWDDEDNEGECVDRLCDYIENRRAVIYAHNGGRFDFHYMLHRADDITVYGSRIASMRIGEAELRDSLLILPVSLAKMDKTKIDYDLFEWPTRNEPDVKSRIVEYLGDDCRDLYRWVYEFESRFGRKPTLAVAAMAELKKTGYNPQRFKHHTDEKHRVVYSGGRVTAFKPGKNEGPIQYVDINSAYPYAMTYPHPFAETLRTSVMPESAAEQPYFALIDGHTKGAIPIRSRAGKLEYPESDFANTWVSGWEIEAGIETGTLDISKVHHCIVSTDARSMSEYVNKYYEEKRVAKQEGDKVRELFSKLMLNSVYGKFAQNPRKFRQWAIFHASMAPDDPEWRCEATFDYSDWQIWSKADEIDEDTRFYNVLTAASITGFVRAHLWKAIANSRDVIYCDTDSIFCREFNGPIGDRLGEWSVEADISRMWVGGRKIYAAEMTEPEIDKEGKESWYKTACKGARLSPEQIVKMVETNQGIEWQNISPAFRMGRATFTKREIRPT